MKFPAVDVFKHQEKEFHITTTENGSRFNVVVTLNGKQVSPIYGVDLTTYQDYFMQHQASLIGHLIEIAKSDVKSGMYYKG